MTNGPTNESLTRRATANVSSKQPAPDAILESAENGRLDGKVALVTGSSRGIGAAIVIELARCGATVAIHGRDTKALDLVATRIRAAGGLVTTVTGDVTNSDDLEAIRESVENTLGPIDILVANAGGNFTPPAPLEDIPEEGWRATIDGNLLATFLTLKCFLPGMKRRGSGSIITIASAAARRADARTPVAYAAAKAGIIALTQDVAAQAGANGIRANCIAPETILTEHNQERIPLNLQEDMAQTHPLRRLGTPEDVAHAAVFLASDQAGWITGIVLDISGGAIMV